MIPNIKVAFWVSYAKLLQLDLALEKDRMIVRCKGRLFRVHMASNVRKQVFQASCHEVFPLALYTVQQYSYGTGIYKVIDTLHTFNVKIISMIAPLSLAKEFIHTYIPCFSSNLNHIFFYTLWGRKVPFKNSFTFNQDMAC